MSASSPHRWPWLVIAGGLVAAVGVTWAVWPDGEVRVKGETTQARIECIHRLAEEQPAGAGEVIAAAATEETHALVRQAALIALARFPDARVRPAVEAGTRDATPLARAAAARTLGGYGDDEAAAILGKLQAEDPAGRVRIDAALGLERIATANAVALLASAAEHNEFPTVRRVALGALTRLLARHGPDGEAAWEARRWEKLNAEVQRVRPLAERPGPATTQPNEGEHEHGPARTTGPAG